MGGEYRLGYVRIGLAVRAELISKAEADVQRRLVVHGEKKGPQFREVLAMARREGSETADRFAGVESEIAEAQRSVADALAGNEQRFSEVERKFAGRRGRRSSRPHCSPPQLMAAGGWRPRACEVPGFHRPVRRCRHADLA